MLHPEVVIDRLELGTHPELVDPPSGHLDREPGPVHGDVEGLQEVAERADVVFVAVGEHHALDVRGSLFEP